MGVGIRRVHSLSFSALRKLEQIKNKRRDETITRALPRLRSIQTGVGSKISSQNYLTPRLSNALSLAMAPLETPATKRPVKVTESTLLESSQNHKKHLQSTPGLGNSLPWEQSQESTPPTKLFSGESTYSVTSEEVSFSDEPSLEDFIQVRNTILEIARDFVIKNSDLSRETLIPRYTNRELGASEAGDGVFSMEDDLKERIDGILGDGVADLFHVRIVEQGPGRSRVETHQVDADDLDASDKQRILTAAANARVNYASVEIRQGLTGEDIESTLTELQSLVGFRGSDLIETLKSELKNPTNLEVTFANVLNEIENLQLSAPEKARLQSSIMGLKEVAEKIKEEFEKSPYADHLSMSYSSGRYARAYSTSEIETVIERTNNRDWILSFGYRDDYDNT